MQEIEIELKNLLTESEFRLLLSRLPFPAAAQTQTNYYFETRDFKLKQQGSALRIRKKNGVYYLTLKEPYGEGLLETHDVLSEIEAQDWLSGACTIKEHTGERLMVLGVKAPQLKYYGKLTTERRQFAADNLLYVLDQSYYHGITDYELEIEAPDKTSGEQALQRILSDYHITAKETPNKIRRFFKAIALNGAKDG
ncbi:CYTH domain-containing protein [Virgibacillus halophilus]|uniref:CYTH domain-containing protein n=1 Tax=Tigheibacillus halophilus TaxID=361280 RepID=A0ABU5CB43_9BACI|nr:CYTH domain-containing protein [Virgibacillus halophilus]